MERESVLHGINSLQSFETLPLNPNGQKKHGCARPRITRSINLQTWIVQWSLLAETSGTRPSGQIKGGKHPVDLILTREGT
jgi:hypothetical protein